MRGDLCRKQTCTVTVIHYCTEDHQLLIVQCVDRYPSIRPESRFVRYLPHLHSTLRKVWCAKTRIVWLYPMVKKSLRIRLLVLTEFTNVTDGRIDRQADGQTQHDGIPRAEKDTGYSLWPRSHHLTLPFTNNNMIRKNFLHRKLFMDTY